MTGKYEDDSIQILTGLEPVRRRPGMYIGSTDAHGLHHLIWEIEVLPQVDIRMSYGDDGLQHMYLGNCG